MRSAIIIVCMTLLTMSVSCRKTDTGDSPNADMSAVQPSAASKPADPLDECQALLDNAVKVRPTDPAAALEILDQAFERLHDCTYTANQVYWLQMHSKLKQARAELTGGRQEENR